MSISCRLKRNATISILNVIASSYGNEFHSDLETELKLTSVLETEVKLTSVV